MLLLLFVYFYFISACLILSAGVSVLSTCIEKCYTHEVIIIIIIIIIKNRREIWREILSLLQSATLTLDIAKFYRLDLFIFLSIFSFHSWNESK